LLRVLGCNSQHSSARAKASLGGAPIVWEVSGVLAACIVQQAKIDRVVKRDSKLWWPFFVITDGYNCLVASSQAFNRDLGMTKRLKTIQSETPIAFKILFPGNAWTWLRS
jgi:hypothetical protein